MRRYLVVANQTLGGEDLLEQLRSRMGAEEQCEFYVVVPATHPRDHLTWTEGEAQAIAQRRLEHALGRFRTEGANVEGEVGPEAPMDAIEEVLRRQHFDEIILSTLPPGLSRWLGQDLPSRVARRFDLPVAHAVSSTEESD
jgi:nucleotide-binding universal stress UspA family protein